jgi:hypothetical protein
MRRFVTFSALVASFLANPVQADLTIGTFGFPRGGEYAMVGAASLGEIARVYIETNIPGTTFVGTQTLTPAFLDTVDMLILNSATSYTGSTALTAAEQTNLLNFIKSGKGAVVIPDGYASFNGDTFGAPFGVTTGNFASDITTVVAPSHPVVNGPYGTIASQLTDPIGNTDAFFSIGPYATSVAVSSGNVVIAAIAENVISPGSGRVVLFSDAGIAVGSFLADNGLVLNAVDYVSVPVPEIGSSVFTVIGIGAVAILARLRRSR